LKEDREIVLEAVKNYGGALEYASENLKEDREIVLEAVKNDGSALKYASENLQEDRKIILEAENNTKKRQIDFENRVTSLFNKYGWDN
jgi:hypothetical protein